MAKTPTPAARTPIDARGTELLSLIAAAGTAGLMLTQAEGLDAINSGHAVVDTTVVENDTAKVTLTDAGRAALTGSGGVASKFVVRNDVPLPETASQRRGRQSSYPFETLDVNASFHVPFADGEKSEKLVSRLNSSISGARARFATETGEQRLVTVRDYQLGEDGKPVLVDGKKVVTGERQESRPVKTASRDFKLAAVDASDPDGAGVRIWRTA